ncbi:MAG: IS630 family transposase [Candidatus Heimdallarchaeota archaeon]
MQRRIRNRKRDIKKILRLARNERTDLWSLDECHFQQHGTRCRMWIPPEDKDPIVLQAPTRKSVALFGAVNTMTGKLVTMLSPKFNAETFEIFLRRLLRHRKRSRKMVIIIDNARYHHAKVLKPLLKKYHEVLRLDYLPPYSPDLNPIERVWKFLRKTCMHNQYFETLDELIYAVESEMEVWKKPNNILYKLCGII